ncbi:MAG: hypothetical protein JWO12_1265 [Frankiales bacterium]|nr:hypothetical protein [Frankiales bacterium]
MSYAISSTIDIDAPIEQVWATLTDVERYPEWNPFTVVVKTTLELGSPVDMMVALRPPKQRHQVEYVTSYVEGTRVSWGVAVGPRWFIDANRVQELTDLGEGRTRYFTEDTFTGIGVGLMRLLLGAAIQRGFDGVAQGLKQRCEVSARA